VQEGRIKAYLMHCGLEAAKAAGPAAAPKPEAMPKKFANAAAMRQWFNHSSRFGKLLPKSARTD
jgi:hypothetical protein